MEAFHHVLSLLAFVFAICLTTILSRTSALFVARDRVVLSWLSVLAGVNCIVLVFVNWLSFWELRSTPDWSLPAITAVFAFALSVYFTSTLALPQVADDGPLDMGAFYRRERVTYYTSWLICETLAIVCNFLLAPAGAHSALLDENIVNFVMLAPIAVALAIRRTWAQWSGGLGLLAANLTFLLLFETDLR